MTRKDYIAAAEKIRFAHWVRNDAERQLLAETFADFFESDSSRFNRTRFMKAVQDEPAQKS